MMGRSGRKVLALLLSVSPLGCMNWQGGMPMMMVSPHPPVTNAVGGELSSTQSAQLCLTAGEALEARGFAAEAIRQYENARRHDPQTRGVARRLAVLYDLQGDTQHAETEYQRALQEQTGDAELLNDFGYFHYRHDQVQAAEKWLRNAVAVNSGCASAWINLGQVLARQGRAEESYQAFAHVLRPAEAYSNLGVLLAKQGRTSEAREALQKAAALDPSLQQPRAFLNALPSSSPALLPTDLLRNAPTPPALPPAPKSSPALSKAPPSPPPAPPDLRRLPPSSSDVPPLHIDAPSCWRTLPPVLPPAPAVPPAKPTTPSDVPVIVHGPIQPRPVMSSPPPTVQPVVPTAPPPPPPPPPTPLLPPPPPLSPVGKTDKQSTDTPIIIRTRASLPPSSTTSTISFDVEPRPLPPASSVPLKAPRTVRQAQPATTPPQATLLDCQGESETEKRPQ